MKQTARLAGLSYLGLAISGAIGFLLIRSQAAWSVGGLFFGLWLIPMGWLAGRSNYMPRILGWTLIASGIGYILSTYVTYLLPDATVLADILALPATVGEFWMIGYLLWKGVSDRAGV